MRLHVDHPETGPDHGENGFCPSLSKTEVVAIIDALLQAEMTLPLLDERNRSLKPVQRVRSLQLSLAHRLEDLLAEPSGMTPPPP